MNIESGDSDAAPRLIQRECGGWLAVSQAGAQLRIGVTAQTEQDARTHFFKALKEWRELRESPIDKPEVN